MKRKGGNIYMQLQSNPIQSNPLYKSARPPTYEMKFLINQPIQLFKHRGKPISLVSTDIRQGLPL